MKPNIWHIFIWSLIGYCDADVDVGQRCSWINDHRGPLTPDRMAMLDKCIFLHVKKQSQIDVNQDSAKENLFQEVPGVADELSILRGVIYFIRLKESEKSAVFSGHIDLTWTDPGLSWHPKDFLDRQQIYLYDKDLIERLWYPKFDAVNENVARPYFSRQYEANVPQFTGFVPQIEYNGSVLMTLQFEDFVFFDFNYERFPYDSQEICMELKLRKSVYMQTQTLVLKSGDVMISTDKWHPIDGDWRIRSIKLDLTDDKTETLSVCAVIKRHSPSLRTALQLPVVLSALLSVLAPVFGSFSVQAGVKIVALVCQYLCLQQFAIVLQDKPIDTLPAILQFFEFSLVLTTLSLVTVMILWSVGRASHKFPPNALTVSLSKSFNKVFLCAQLMESKILTHSRYEPTADSGPSAGAENSIEGNRGAENEVETRTETPRTYEPNQQRKIQEEWAQVISAASNLSFIAFSFIYIVGMLILIF